jgi:hypothetical protein
MPRSFCSEVRYHRLCPRRPRRLWLGPQGRDAAGWNPRLRRSPQGKQGSHAPWLPFILSTFDRRLRGNNIPRPLPPAAASVRTLRARPGAASPRRRLGGRIDLVVAGVWKQHEFGEMIWQPTGRWTKPFSIVAVCAKRRMTLSPS